MKVNLHATAIAHRRRAISTNRSLEEVRRDAKTTFSAVEHIWQHSGLSTIRQQVLVVRVAKLKGWRQR